MLDVAGEHLQYIAFHHMFNPDRNLPNSPLRGIEYRKDPAWTWERLMNAHKVHEARIQRMREEVGDYPVPLALTECHFALPGRNRCEVLSTWAAGVANARLLNVHERHGDKLKIATLADFCGTRWQVNAVMIPVPGGKSFMMPVALVMSLYRHHTGEKAVGIEASPGDLDVTASRTADRVYLHVVNTRRDRSITARLTVKGMKVASGRIFEMAGNPEYEVIQTQPDEIVPVEKSLPLNCQWTFPSASVSAVELDVQKA
jgi:alpha-N-arabinofuranosidase